MSTIKELRFSSFALVSGQGSRSWGKTVTNSIFLPWFAWQIVFSSLRSRKSVSWVAVQCTIISPISENYWRSCICFWSRCSSKLSTNETRTWSWGKDDATKCATCSVHTGSDPCKLIIILKNKSVQYKFELTYALLSYNIYESRNETLLE